MDAGATDAITQFFFEPDTYLRFLETARATGITAPIAPSVMPVVDFSWLGVALSTQLPPKSS
jgi:methylenetetrahydrofolate reductase (NADPH)